MEMAERKVIQPEYRLTPQTIPYVQTALEKIDKDKLTDHEYGYVDVDN